MGSACRYSYKSACKYKLQQDRRNNLFMEGLKCEDFDLRESRKLEKKVTSENVLIRRQLDTNAICQELDKYKREQIAESKRGQQLRQNAEQVRELIINLNAANTRKVLSEQLIELERKRKEAECRKREEIAEFQNELDRYQQSTRELEQETIRKKFEYGRALKEQMSAAQRRREMEHAEVLRDKDERMRQQQKDEELRRAELKEMLRLKKIKKMELDDYLAQHQSAKEQRREKEKLDQLTTDDVQRDMEARQRAIDQAAKQIRLRRIELSERIGGELHTLNTEKRIAEDKLFDLLMEEHMNKLERLDREKIENEMKQKFLERIETDEYLKGIRHFKQVCRDKEEAMYKAERDRIEAQQIEKDALEKERHRQKQLKYVRNIKGMMEYQRRQRAVQRAESLRDDEILRSMELKRQEQIDAERLSLLRKQPELMPYMATNVLRKSEYEMFAVQRNEDPAACRT